MDGKQTGIGYRTGFEYFLVVTCCRLPVFQGSVLASLKKESRIITRAVPTSLLSFLPPFSHPDIAAETKYGGTFIPQTFNFCHPIKKMSLKHCPHLEQKLIWSLWDSEVSMDSASLIARIVVLWFPLYIFVFSTQQWAPSSRYFLWSLYCQWPDQCLLCHWMNDWVNDCKGKQTYQPAQFLSSLTGMITVIEKNKWFPWQFWQRALRNRMMKRTVTNQC